MRRRGPSLVRAAATTAVVAGTATAVSGHVSNKQANKQAEQQAQQQAQQAQMQPVAAPVEAAPAEDDDMAKLQQLGQLHATGVLTDEEFAAAKAKVLGI